MKKKRIYKPKKKLTAKQKLRLEFFNLYGKMPTHREIMQFLRNQMYKHDTKKDETETKI